MKSLTVQTLLSKIQFSKQIHRSKAEDFRAEILFFKTFLFFVYLIFYLIVNAGVTFANETSVANKEISVKFQCPFATSIAANDKGNIVNVNVLAENSYSYFIFQSAAKKIFEAYFSNQLTKESFDQCMQFSGNEQWFLQAVNAEFFRRSLAILRASKAPATRRLMQLYDSIYQNQGGDPDQHALFRLTGHIRDLSPTALQAGFHRGNHSIFMDISRIAPADWLLIFTHELIHSLDEIAFEALPIYQDDLTKRKLIQWAQTGGRVDKIPGEIEDLLWPWLKAGLNLGLLSEYRAWVVTAWVYLDEVEKCNWKRSTWFETILNQSSSTQEISRERSIKQITFQYLDQHFPDRNDEVFGLPAINSALKKIRTETREEVPDMGAFEQINPGDDKPITARVCY